MLPRRAVLACRNNEHYDRGVSEKHTGPFQIFISSLIVKYSAFNRTVHRAQVLSSRLIKAQQAKHRRNISDGISGHSSFNLSLQGDDLFE